MRKAFPVDFRTQRVGLESFFSPPPMGVWSLLPSTTVTVRMSFARLWPR